MPDRQSTTSSKNELRHQDTPAPKKYNPIKTRSDMKVGNKNLAKNMDCNISTTISSETTTGTSENANSNDSLTTEISQRGYFGLKYSLGLPDLFSEHSFSQVSPEASYVRSDQSRTNRIPKDNIEAVGKRRKRQGPKSVPNDNSYFTKPFFKLKPAQ